MSQNPSVRPHQEGPYQPGSEVWTDPWTMGTTEDFRVLSWGKPWGWRRGFWGTTDLAEAVSGSQVSSSKKQNDDLEWLEQNHCPD